MELRVILFRHGLEHRETLEHILKDAKVIDHWTEAGGDPIRQTTRILLEQHEVERLVDALTHRFGTKDTRIIITPVEATVPRVPDEEVVNQRLNREALQSSIESGIKVNPVLLAMSLLSALVAAVGLLKDSVAVIIGAMVIAPLLGPNMGLALAATLGDARLLAKSLRAGIVTITIAFAVSLAAGFAFPDDITPEMQIRTQTDFGDVLLALVSGSAGAIAATSSLASSLIGVMVAVALMPPLVNMGLLLAAGNVPLALGAGLLLATNVIAVNLAAVVTFAIRGVRPGRWWDHDRARRAMVKAVALWVVLLAVLSALIWYARYR